MTVRELPGLLTAVSFLTLPPAGDGLSCWECSAGQLDECDKLRQPTSCPSHAQSCGTFLYFNETAGPYWFGKACLSENQCRDEERFCADIHGSSHRYCRVECCDGDRCNSAKMFKPRNDELCTWDSGATGSTLFSGFLAGACVLLSLIRL